MLSWLLPKKRGAAAPTSANPSTPSPRPLGTSATPPAPSKAAQVEAAKAEWSPRLQSALGDDGALLQLALTAPVLEIRCAAVEAISAEDTLKQAERDLRAHDSRVHRIAKRRWAKAVAQREARTRAQALIESAQALLTEVQATDAPLPANRLVALDRDWQALEVALLAPEQVAAFNAVREQLNTLLREQGEAEQRRQHEARQRAAEQAAQLAAEQAARELAREVAQRAEEQAATEAAAVAAAEQVAQQALPADAQTSAAGALSDGSEPQAAAPTLAPPKPLDAAQRQRLESALTQAEAAVAEGHLAELQQHLQTVDVVLAEVPGARVGDKLRSRHQALLAERARLKGWQQWGGARALDTLVAEAEALAQRTVAAAAPADEAAAARPPKLNVKAHADAIQSLRVRWKEIDRSGAPSNQSLWQRFDEALKIAYQPVAVQQVAQKAARDENLKAREALLDALDAVPAGEPPAEADSEAATSHWKEQLRALTQFQQAWRQLGPVEHTVPAAARQALLARQQRSVERLEAPLEQARRGAQARREQLVLRAEALVQELARQPGSRDAVPRVRDLQAEWQQQARALPLARSVENALWTRFKTATDAVFAQREAAFQARDAEQAAQLAAREALLARLTGLDLAATPVAELQRTLGEVERAWRAPADVPRAAMAALDERFRAARAAVAEAVANSARRHWLAQCDALVERLALCEAREAAQKVSTGTSSDVGPDVAPDGAHESDLAARWAAAAAVPAAWQQALAQRWAQPTAAGASTGAGANDSLDTALLSLEAALDLPATPAQQQARRDLKLQALKNALEGRSAQARDPARAQAADFAALLRRQGLDASARARLQALVQALRQAAPGTWA